MSFLDLDKLENLQELRQLPELRNMQHMDQLQNLDKLNQLQHMDQLQNLDKLNQMQNFQELRNLDKLDQLQNFQQLQHLDKMAELQNLNQLSQMQHLSQIQNLDKLSQLHLLGKMSELHQLNMLKDMQNMQSLNNLKSLDKLQVLDRLAIFDRLLRFESLFYLLSFLVPGLIFQEVIALLLGGLSIKRALVLMTLYNVISILGCLLFVYHLLPPLEAYPLRYYGAWFAILIAVPALLGWLVALITPAINRVYNHAVNIPTKIMANKWGSLLSGANTYQIIITMTNEEKIRGLVTKEIPTPETIDPNGLYLTETSHYSPTGQNWEDLERPVGVWVKGTEIKMMEVTPET